MNPAYSHIANLAELLSDIPSDSIVSRAIYSDEQIKVTLFGFAAGQELSEHTASQPAILHFLKGEAHLTLGGEAQAAAAGTWVHMPANLQHSVLAKTPVVMLLLLLKTSERESEP